MNYDQIKARLSELVKAALVKAALAKGVERPNFDMTLKADANTFIYMNSYSFLKAEFCYGETPEKMFEAAFAFVAALPDPATAAIQRHMERVADCIDKGREDGIDDAYITPLVAVKTAMTENLLMKPAPQEATE